MPAALNMSWRNSNEIHLVRNVGRRTRRFLVYVNPRKDMKSPLSRLSLAERNFDLALRFYDDPGVNADLMDGADYVMSGGLSKFHAAALFFEEIGTSPAYDGYLFLDGDLEFDARQLNHFLAFVHAAGLDLAQPSLTRDSYCYWSVAFHQPRFILRETNFVEVMAPYLSSRAFTAVLPTFKRSISTYGLDLVWPHLIDGPSIGIVDAFQMRHRERVDHASGPFYNYLKSIDVDLDEEERKILEDYGITPEHAHSRRGYFWRKDKSSSTGERLLFSVPLTGIERHTVSRLKIDLSMFLARRAAGQAEERLTRAVAPHLSGSRLQHIARI